MKVGQSNWKKACFLPTKADANVVAYRKWNWKRYLELLLLFFNIEFTKGKKVDSSVLKDHKAKFHLKMTVELLRCGSVGLEDALCKRVMIAPDEIIKRSLDPISAAVNRDGLAKTIYSRLFIGVKLFYKRG
ncbi:putative myosin head, motor domain, P-loop containing nucleoside triphosphate hydrolase [Helianthus anomalus]